MQQDRTAILGIISLGHHDVAHPTEGDDRPFNQHKPIAVIEGNLPTATDQTHHGEESPQGPTQHGTGSDHIDDAPQRHPVERLFDRNVS